MPSDTLIAAALRDGLAQPAERVLAVGAHPDDIELGCGGILALLAQKRIHVAALVVTDGAGNGRQPAVRYAESQRAARMLGVSELRFGHVRDGRAAEESRLVHVLDRCIRVSRPTFVLTHAITLHEHNDHTAVAAATRTACTKFGIPMLGYEGPTYPLAGDFVPTVFVDIGAVWPTKRRAILAHVSEVRRGSISLDHARCRAQHRAAQAGWDSALAEALQVNSKNGQLTHEQSFLEALSIQFQVSEWQQGHTGVGAQ